MRRPRVVIDTNVLVSAALKPAGKPAFVLQLVAFRAVEMCVSKEIMAEYREVLARPKFSRLDRNAVSQLLALIEGEATIVMPTERLRLSEHESENRFYECAAAAGADYIVTGNIRHFGREYRKIRVVSSQQLLELLMGSADPGP